MPANAVRPFTAQRPLVVAAVAYGAGIALANAMAFRPPYGLIGLCAALSFAVFFRKRRPLRVCALSAALFCIGLFYSGFMLSPSTPPEGTYAVMGYVSGETRLTATGRRAAMLTDVHLTNESGERYDIRKVYWSYTPDEEGELPLIDGRQIAFTARLYVPSPQMNPYGFDFRLYLMTQGVSSGLSGARDLSETGLDRLTFSGAMLRARQAIEGMIDSLFGGDAAMPKALLLGVRDELPEDVTEQFGESGVTHVLAVSGLHVGLLAGMLSMLLRAFRLSRKNRLIVMLIFLMLYCALLNFSAPVLRASMLFLFAEWGRIRRRRRDGMTLLAAAFLVLLLFRPLDLFSVSFQLSFAAVLGITLLYRRFSQFLSFIKWWALRDALCLTLSAALFTALPVASMFHRLSLVGFIVSPLVCALLMPLLLLYVLSLLFGVLWLLVGQIIAVPAICLSRFITLIAETGAGLPFAAVNLPAPNAAWFIFAFALALSASGYLLWRKRWKIIVCLSLACLALGIDALSVRRDVTYIQFSVSQQDAALLIDGRQTVLFDTSQTGGDVADYLLSTGLSADTVILSHLHADHCMGLRDLMKSRVPIGRVLLPTNAEHQLADPECLQLLDEIRAAGIPLVRVSAGDTIQTPRTNITVLFPDENKMKTGVDANLYAAAFLLETNGARMLIMSDTDGIYENYIAVPADILKVAHHGSNGATGDDFLSTVSPSVAIISCGASNEFLPSPKLIKRLDRSVPSWYRTDKAGALTITFTQDNISITPYLRTPP